MKKNQDFRNYNKEAREMIHDLSRSQCYELYEIALGQLKRYQPETRQKELEAVCYAIEERKDLDQDRIRARKRGYRTQMAEGAKARDGNSKPNRKKV